MPELLCRILHIGKTTYYKYVKNNYAIIQFLQQFSKEELEELEKYGNIKKIDLVKNLSYEQLYDLINTNNTTINITTINSKLLSLNNQALLRTLRVSLKNADEKSNFYNFVEKTAKNYNFFTELVKSFYTGDSDIISQNHFKDLENILPLIFTKYEIEEMIKNKNIYIKNLTIMIDSLY